jgi:hypothetical protein
MCIGENSRVDAGRGDGVLRCILLGRGIRRGSGSGSGRGIIGNARAKRFHVGEGGDTHTGCLNTKGVRIFVATGAGI